MNQRSSRFEDLTGIGASAWRLFADPRVPLAVKAIPVLAALYVVSPLDFLPDVAPVLGQLDDVAILLIGLRLFTQLAGRFQSAPPGPAGPIPVDQTINASYRVRED